MRRPALKGAFLSHPVSQLPNSSSHIKSFNVQLDPNPSKGQAPVGNFMVGGLGAGGNEPWRLPYRGDAADLPVELGAVAGAAERTLLHGFAAVDGAVGGGADVEGVVHVVVELVGVSGVLLTCRQDLASL